MEGNKERGSPITTGNHLSALSGGQFGPFTTKKGERDRKRKSRIPHLEDSLSRDVWKFIEDDSVTP